MTILNLPAVAGVPWEYIVHDDIPIETPDFAGWAGTAVREPPVQVHHVLAPASVEGLRPVMELPPWSTYYLDDARLPHVRFHELPGLVELPQLLVTRRGGYDYEVRYDRRPTGPVAQRDKELALITMVLAERDRGVLVHSCGFVHGGGRAVVCPGVSETGKSTLARILRQAVPDVRLLNDDRVILTSEPQGIHAWAAPWPGREGIANVDDAPLGVVAFLGRSSEPAVRSVSPREALRRLFAMIALPLWNAEQTTAALAHVERMVTEYPVIELRYPPTAAAAEWIYDTTTRIGTSA